MFFLYFGKMELSSPKSEKVLIFSRKKAFLIFQETELFKNFLYFRRELSEL